MKALWRDRIHRKSLSGLISLLSTLTLGLGVAFSNASLASDAASARADDQAFVTVGEGGNPTDLRSSNAITQYLYFPFVASPGCLPIVTETYGTVVAFNHPPDDPPAEDHPDLNLALRGYAITEADLTLVDYLGEADPGAPQFPGLFGDNRIPTFRTAYRVYDWDQSCNCRGQLITDWDVTLLGMDVSPGEIIRVPGSGYDIGTRPSGYEVMVLYAGTSRITLKYTRDDNIIFGYTLYLENLCVEPKLLALYQTMNAAGRAQLPALFAGQGIGRAIGDEIGIVIRDTGSFMDPRSRKDWWQVR